MAVNTHVAMCGSVYMQVPGSDFIYVDAYIYEDGWDGVALCPCVGLSGPLPVCAWGNSFSWVEEQMYTYVYICVHVSVYVCGHTHVIDTV